MHILPRIKEVLAARPNEPQLDAFLHDVRDSLAASNRQFLSLATLTLSTLVVYQLVVYENGTGVSLLSVQISDASLFRRVFLVLPAALLSAGACVGYLRHCQREVYDYLTISRYRVLGRTGLHELRLPSDHVLGLFLVLTQGGKVGKIVAGVVAVSSFLAFVAGPVIYIVYESVKNVRQFGFTDPLGLAGSAIAIALTACALVITWLAMRVKVE